MMQRWLVIHIASPSDEHNALLAEGLIAFGATAVVEQHGWLRTWLQVPDPEAHTFVARVRDAVEAIAGGSLELRWEWREEDDWSARWREGLAARRVGKRIIVTPSWITPDAGSDDIVLTIDPQMAFGTGEHASTRGALALLEDTLRPSCRVLDVGTGSAILAIAAALLGAARVDAVESDADALDNAADNIERHGCSDRVRLRHATVDLDYLAGTACAEGPYDVIVGNVLSGVLTPLLPGFGRALRQNGVLILAGILTHEADALIEAATQEGFRLSAELREEPWWSGAFHGP